MTGVCTQIEEHERVSRSCVEPVFLSSCHCFVSLEEDTDVVGFVDLDVVSFNVETRALIADFSADG